MMNQCIWLSWWNSTHFPAALSHLGLQSCSKCLMVTWCILSGGFRGEEVIAMTIPGACGSFSKHHLYTFFFVWRFDSWKRWKLSYSLKQTWFMSICMGVWKIWFISDFTGWGWLKKGQNTDHWPWWFCGSSIEASMELLYYKYLMLLNVKKPTNIFIPESWTMVWVWQCFQTFLALKKTWPSKMLGFSFATQLPWSRVWQHYAFKATSTSHASCFPKWFCFQRCISTFKANLTKNKHPIKLKSN